MEPTKKIGLVKLAKQIITRFNELPAEERESFMRAYDNTMNIAHLSARGYTRPTERSRDRLMDLQYAIEREIHRQANPNNPPCAEKSLRDSITSLVSK